MRNEQESTPHARIPADIDTPDKIIYGLTARQAAILGVAALACYGIWRAVGHLLPAVTGIGMLIPIAGVAVVVALGQRDGLSLDAWLLAAVRHQQTPRRAVPAPEGTLGPPSWAPDLPVGSAGRPPTVLRLPASAITSDGVITLDPDTAAAMVAATTVNIGLRTGDEQWALLAAYGRWLNSLTGPVQIVIAAQRADLTGHATRVVEAVEVLANDALADAAEDYAQFLLDIAAGRDPLWRSVTVLATATRGAAAEARRRAAHTATALSALGAETRVLDGGAATAVLTAAVDPYQYGDSSYRRAQPQIPLTTPQGAMP